MLVKSVFAVFGINLTTHTGGIIHHGNNDNIQRPSIVSIIHLHM